MAKKQTSTCSNCRDLLSALKGMLAAHESYSNEFNPGKKVKAVADWALINDAFMAASAAIAKAEKKP